MKLKTFKLDFRHGKPGRYLSAFDLGKISEQIGQKVEVVYIANLDVGGVAGNHYHKEKVEMFVCLHGEVQVLLVDVETGEKKELTLSAAVDDEHNVGLFIPANVAHTVKNTAEEMSRLAVFANHGPRVEGDDFEYQI